MNVAGVCQLVGVFRPQKKHETVVLHVIPNKEAYQYQEMSRCFSFSPQQLMLFKLQKVSEMAALGRICELMFSGALLEKTRASITCWNLRQNHQTKPQSRKSPRADRLLGGRHIICSLN